MTTNRELLTEILSKFDFEDGEWPGLSVFAVGEGRSIFGLVDDELRELLVELQERLEADDEEVNWNDD